MFLQRWPIAAEMFDLFVNYRSSYSFRLLFLVSVSPRLGIYYTMAIIGPAVGYVIGGQLLLVYTDFMHIDALA